MTRPPERPMDRCKPSARPRWAARAVAGAGLLAAVLVSAGSGAAAGAAVFPAASPVAVAGAASVSLDGVSCPADGNCLAVGSFLGTNHDKNGPLLAFDTTSGWKTSPAPVPEAALPGNAANTVAAVSCPSASTCLAVGAYKSAKGQFPLVVTALPLGWLDSDGITLPANSALWNTGALAGVSCARAWGCAAVGGYEAGGGSTQGLGAVLANGSWKATEVSFGATSTLAAISCVPTACLAVGHGVATGSSPQALAVAESGGHFGAPFTVRAPHNSSGVATELAGVSCTQAKTCTVVGSYEPTTTELTTAMAAGEVNGAWQPAVAIKLPAGAPDNATSELTAVSCLSPGNCEAVGGYTNGSGTMRPMVADETAGAWAPAVAVSVPSGHGAAELNAISCSSPSSCGAVGGAGRDIGLAALTAGAHAVTTPMPPAPATPTASAPALMAVAQGNNATGIAYEGPRHSLWFSWQTFGGGAWHPEQISGPNTAFSAPSIAETTDATAIAVQGPGHDLMFWWQQYGSSYWHAEQVAGPGTTYSVPSLSEGNNSNGIAVRGPSDSLDFYWQTYDRVQWTEEIALGPGNAYSAPSLTNQEASSLLSTTGLTYISVQGPLNSLLTCAQQWGQGGWGCWPVEGEGTTYSPPAAVQTSTGDGSLEIAYQGPGNSLQYYWQNTDGGHGTETVAAAGTVASAPAMAVGNNATAIAVAGTGKSLDFYWQTTGHSGWGLETVSSAGTYSEPAMVEGNGTTSVVAQGPSQSLAFYWQNFGGSTGWVPETAGANGSTY